MRGTTCLRVTRPDDRDGVVVGFEPDRRDRDVVVHDDVQVLADALLARPLQPRGTVFGGEPDDDLPDPRSAGQRGEDVDRRLEA